jgi:poly(3-hydroxybutyrate) depolymerase
MTVKGAGHYGIFSGRRWRDVVYPEVRAFIRERAAAPAAPAARKAASKKTAVAKAAGGKRSRR